MLLAGDEFGRTQGGNNNAYCQDNEISWLNWDIKDKGRNLVRFVAKVTALRRRLQILHRSRFLTAQWNEELGIKDVTWLRPDGEEMGDESWNDANARCMGILLDGRAQASGIRRRRSDAGVLVVMNAHHDGVPFRLPSVPGGTGWRCLIDTNVEDEPDGRAFKFDEDYVATGRSLLLFELLLDKAYLEARRASVAAAAAD